MACRFCEKTRQLAAAAAARRPRSARVIGKERDHRVAVILARMIRNVVRDRRGAR
jgi:hypothetical protein